MQRVSEARYMMRRTVAVLLVIGLFIAALHILGIELCDGPTCAKTPIR